MSMRYIFQVKLWKYPGEVAWYFMSVPKKESQKIKAGVRVRRGWGSVKVRAKIGKTNWETSIFSDSQSGVYLLPVKASVRRMEGIDEGELVRVMITTL